MNPRRLLKSPRAIGLVLFVILVTLSAMPAKGDPALIESVNSRLEPLVATYRYLHANPELSYEEEQTAKFLADRLRKLGFEVTERVGDYAEDDLVSYGLVALLRNGDGPTVMVRTDLDGLPIVEETGVPYASKVRTTDDKGAEVGVMHACGHDLHMASWLGTAEMLVRNKNSWRGTLMMIAQPAEERGAGARAMLRAGLYEKFPRPDYALALHTAASLPAGMVGLRGGYALANVDSVDVTIRGIGGHGAYPQTTKDPIAIAAQAIVHLQTIVSRQISPLDPAVVTVGSIHGGTKHNIIPNEVKLQLTVRSYKPEVRRQLLDSIERVMIQTAAAAGVPEELAPIVEVSENEFTPSTYNNPELTDRLGNVFKKTLGDQAVIFTDPVMGGEDFGMYSLEDHSIPASMFWLGAVQREKFAEYQASGKALPSLHSSEFAPDATTALRTGVAAMTAAVMDLMGAN